MTDPNHTVSAFSASCPALDGLDQCISPTSATDELSPGSGLPRPHRSRSRVSRRAEPFIIGVAGGTASGKTTVCDLIMQNLHGGHGEWLGLGSGRAGTLSIPGSMPSACALAPQPIAITPVCALPPTDQCVVMLSQDSFYCGLTPEQSANAGGECGATVVGRGLLIAPVVGPQNFPV